MLGFMNHSIYEIASFEIQEMNQKDIAWMKVVQQEIRRITLYLHDISHKKDDLGVKTYEYFTDDKNVDELIKILDRDK